MRGPAYEAVAARIATFLLGQQVVAEDCEVLLIGSAWRLATQDTARQFLLTDP